MTEPVWWGGAAVALAGVVLWAWRRSVRARPAAHSSSTFFPSDLDSLQNTAVKAVLLERRHAGHAGHAGDGGPDALSGMVSNTPAQHAVVMATEQCLVAVQMTGAGLEGPGGLPDALDRLRARVQQPIDKLGIQLSWRVERREELQAVTGPVARQALHIAQESLANVVQHAGASRVEVVCRFVPEHGTLVMEVRDNGRGMHKQHGAGAGLKSMRRAAERLGGDLSLASKQGAGTRVRLTLALGPVVARSFDVTRPWRDEARQPRPTKHPLTAGRV